MTDAELALIRAEVATLNVHELRTAVVLQRREIEELRGESNTLAGILMAAYRVLLTVDGDNDDEEQMLIDLRTTMVYALDPYRKDAPLL